MIRCPEHAGNPNLARLRAKLAAEPGLPVAAFAGDMRDADQTARGPFGLVHVPDWPERAVPRPPGAAQLPRATPVEPAPMWPRGEAGMRNRVVARGGAGYWWPGAAARERPPSSFSTCEREGGRMANRRTVALLLLLVAGGACLVLLLGYGSRRSPPAPPEEVTAAGGTVPAPRAPEAGEPPERTAPPSPGASAPGPAPALVAGRVVFGDGSPAPGARVSLSFGGTLLPGSGIGPRAYTAEAETDGDGRFEVRAVDSLRSLPERYRLSARLGERFALLEDLEGDAPPDLVLEDGLIVSGRIVDGTGAPVPRAAAAIWAARDGLDEYHDLAALSDAEGRVSFHPLRRSEGWHLRLTVTHPAFPPTEFELDTAKLLAGEPFEAVLPTGVEVRGVLVEASGRPARGRHVLVLGRDGSDRPLLAVPATITDEAGAFVLTGVPAEGADLLASEVAPLAGLLADIPYRFAEVAARNGQSVDLGRIILEARGAIRGSVVEQGGRPVEGATVGAGIGALGVLPASTQTAADGRFELRGLPPGEYEVTAARAHPTRGRIESRLAGVRPDGPEVVLDLTGGGAIVFHLHPAGQPTEPLAVRGFGGSFTPLPRPAPRADGSFESASGGWSSMGAASAHWRHTLAPGTYEVTVRATGYAPVQLGEVKVHPDRDTEIDVALEPE